MKQQITLSIGRIAILAGVILGLTLSPAAGLAENVSPTDKWAWSTNAGWLNFAPSAGGDTSYGVTVYADHLEGYAWGENIGWIRLGAYTGGGAHTYGNTSASNYGVNRSGSQLSGYAWGSNVGWIKFDPANGGVTVDPATGGFDGYAWGENIGWIHVRGTGTVAYQVVAPASQPAAAPVVTIRSAPAGAVLSWTHLPANGGGYEIWWSSAPYFTPGASGAFSATLPAPTVVYTHTSASGVNDYFVVLGVNAVGQTSSTSNQTGKFTFTLTPGN